jgi:hypothetical protein
MHCAEFENVEALPVPAHAFAPVQDWTGGAAADQDGEDGKKGGENDQPNQGGQEVKGSLGQAACPLNK